MNIVKISVAFVGGMLAFAVLMGCFFIIDAGERGVVLRNGEIIGSADPGLHGKMPIIDSVSSINVQSNVSRFEGMQTYTRDQQVATLRVSVNYHVIPERVEEVYRLYHSVEAMVSRTIAPQLPQVLETVLGQYTAVTAVQERAKLNADIQKAVRASVAESPMVIESVQLENIDFDESYEQSIAARMQEEVKVQKLRQLAEQEKINAEITVTKAHAAADSQVAVAEAEARAIIVKGEAEAKTIKLRGDALKENPNLIDLTKAEKWDGRLPTTMVPSSAVPFLNVQ